MFNVILQVVRLSDEVTVSTLPHPISMFFLGIFAVTIIFLIVEMTRLKREWKSFFEKNEKNVKELETFVETFESRISEVSKKVDSRVDKALLGLKKNH